MSHGLAVVLVSLLVSPHREPVEAKKPSAEQQMVVVDILVHQVVRNCRYEYDEYDRRQLVCEEHHYFVFLDYYWVPNPTFGYSCVFLINRGFRGPYSGLKVIAPSTIGWSLDYGNLEIHGREFWTLSANDDFEVSNWRVFHDPINW